MMKLMNLKKKLVLFKVQINFVLNFDMNLFIQQTTNGN